MAINQTPPQPIAIVGSSCRFPGQSTSPSKLYELLRQPKDVRRDFDPEILNLQRFYDENPDAPGSTNVKPKGYLLSDDTRTFDASFFNISPYEAESMDPQLRVMLETVYEAFESAGYTLDQMRGSKTSVHVGVMTSDYYDILTRDPETVPLYAGTGVTRSILSNRISYTFDLHGPSVTLDTACSSSLVALHQAVQGLQTGDATCAVVCGVNLIFDPMLYVMLSKLHMLSPDSQSRMWDKTVNGYARGEGAGCVVLKPLGQALRDGDTIEGIIRGSGVNSDGQSMGLTMPTVEAQATLIRDVYQRAGLDPIKDRCQYFECHGTGTPVGDPVESRAIYEAMIQGGETSGFKPKDPLYVGSIKTIIGHLEGGAGLAGVMKALLSIKHKTIFPNLLFDELNPAIKPYYDGFKVPTSPTPWPELPDGTPLRVSVNSFGFGGTNAHAIIESYEPKDGSETHLGAQDLEEPLGPFVLSANIATSLIGNAKSLLRYLNEKPSVDLTDLSWALQNKRGAHRVRTFFTAQSREALIESLEKFITQHRKSTGKDEIGIRARPADPQKKPRTIGIFTGQGAQWPTMGRGLLSSSPTFRRVIEQCDKILSALPDGPEWSLMEELSKDADTSRVAEAVISQPICTAVQLGLVEILRESGVHLDTVVGHSSGEITAAYICGIIDAAAALQIAYYRGKCAHQACGADGQPGGMLAVGIDFDVADAFCKQPQYQGRLGVAASNAPKSVTLSGDLDAVKEAKTHFDQDGIFARQLQVDTAYHSHHMDRCAETYLKSLATCNISVHPPKDDCSWVSSVRGDSALSEDDLDSVKGPYWVKNMVQTVLFCPAIQSAVQIGGNFDLSIEIGPNPTLRGPTQQTLELAQGAAPPHIGTLKRNANDVESLGETMGTIWCHLGVAHVNFDGFRRTFASSKPKTIKLLKDLPVYAWDHDRVYWSESRISKNYRKRDDMRHPLLGRRVSDDTDQIMRWRNVLKIADLPWTQGHVVSGEVLLPGTSYIAMACDAASYIAGLSIIRRIEIEDVKIRRAVIVPDSREGVETTFTMRLEESKGSDRIAGDFSYHFSDNGSMVHAGNGKIVAYLGAPSEHELPPFQPTGLTLYPIDSDTSYETIAQNGFLYTGPFRRLEGIQRKLDYAVAEAEWSLDEVSGDYTLHPAIMDVSWQNLFTASADPRAGQLPTLILPVGIKRVTINPNLILNTQGTIKTRNEAFITTRDGAAIAGDVHIYDVASGNAVVQMESVILEPIAPPSEEQDRKMFFDTIYKEDPMLRLVEPVYDPEECQRVQELSSDIERVCLVYVQHVLRELKPDERPGLEWFHKRLITAFENYVESTREDRHPVAQKAWLTDSPSILEAIYAKWPGVVDLEVVRVCGENMLDTLRKKTSLLELMMEGDLSTRLYSDGCGLAQANHGMTHVLEQISHKFPLARYVEIGAGTGSTVSFEAYFDASCVANTDYMARLTPSCQLLATHSSRIPSQISRRLSSVMARPGSATSEVRWSSRP
jgi:acyl transferase domain-containing protein